MEGEHALGLVHLHAGSHDPRPPLQIIHIPEAGQEAQVLCGDTGRTPPPGAASADGPADEWEETNLGTTGADYGPRLQVPKGSVLIEGADYIPFNI